MHVCVWKTRMHLPKSFGECFGGVLPYWCKCTCSLDAKLLLVNKETNPNKVKSKNQHTDKKSNIASLCSVLKLIPCINAPLSPSCHQTTFISHLTCMTLFFCIKCKFHAGVLSFCKGKNKKEYSCIWAAKVMTKL